MKSLKRNYHSIEKSDISVTQKVILRFAFSDPVKINGGRTDVLDSDKIGDRLVDVGLKTQVVGRNVDFRTIMQIGHHFFMRNRVRFFY